MGLTASVEGLLISSVSAVSMRHHILDATSNTNHLRLLLTEQDWGRNQGTRSYYSNSFNLPNFLNDDDSIQPASGGTGSKCSK